MARYLTETNANSGGRFQTSRASEAVAARAREHVAALLGADDPDTIVFGASMTALTQAAARAMARLWGPGDEIVVTRLDHDANITPWVRAAEEAGATVRHAGIRTADCTLDLEDLESKISGRTRLVAVGAASNAVGTINPVRRIADRVHAVGGLVFVDAVHYAPHGAIDVRAWDCDLLACSAYKFFGPHVGILWGRRALLREFPVYKLRPVTDEIPGRWDSGTPNYEGIAGTLAAVEYLAELGARCGATSKGLRDRLRSAFESIVPYERGLVARLLEGAAALRALSVRGITDASRFGERVPTVALTHARLRPIEVAERLGEQGIFVWHGNYYAIAVTEALALEPDGMVRIGLLHYNTADEVDRLLGALAEL